MGYKLLGMVVWKVGKSLLRYRVGGVRAPRALLAGAALLVLAGILLAARSRGEHD